MSKRTKLSVSGKEPAERVATVTLSVAELIWLANFHRREMRGVTKRLSQAMMEACAGSALPQLRLIRELKALGMEQIQGHAKRGEELLNLAKAHLNFNAGGEG